ncbi:MAG: AMP-binding protein [Pseudomonadota bacterium]
MIKKTPVEAWVRSRMNLKPDDVLTREKLLEFQLRLLSETLAFARTASPFYRKKLAGRPEKPLEGPADLQALPFTTARDLREEHLQMLAVSRDRIARVVTLQTSGTTTLPKRVYFTNRDLEQNVDFFHHGITTLVEPGQKVLILMPGPAPGSVGDILARGLAEMKATGIVHGPVTDPSRTIEDIVNLEIDALVGLPTQVLSLCRHPRGLALPPGRIKNVLLSADRASLAIINEISKTWNCRVFDHYGMTEMGLGGGVQCEALAGYHLRDAELLFEVVHPETGAPVPDGETGEVVFSTLVRRGMPLLRYRTGDLAAFIPTPCPCGGILRTLGRLQGRLNGAVMLAGKFPIDIIQLDEAFFKIPGIINFSAEITRKKDRDILRVQIFAEPGAPASLPSRTAEAAAKIPAISQALAAGSLELEPVSVSSSDWISSGSAKRKIIVHGMEPY